MHRSVLLHELIDGLSIAPGDTILDATLDGGGHSEEILKRFGSLVSIVGIDADSDAIVRAKERLAPYHGRVTFCEGNFRRCVLLLKSAGITSINRALFDLGFSSDQLETSGRGFSFQRDEPLVMTFKKNPGADELTAYEIVNHWNDTRLADAIYTFGEERSSRIIARAILAARSISPLKTSGELARVVEKALSRNGRGRIHPATKTFQALRIAVNDELQALEEGIKEAFSILSSGGRMGVISFHSIEDRVVKQRFRAFVKEGRGRLINKRVITPKDSEREDNPRSRSGKLRLIQKI